MEDLTPRGSPLRVSSFPFQQLGLSSFKSLYACYYTSKFLITSHARYTRIQKGSYIRYITQGVANLTDWMRMRPSDIPHKSLHLLPTIMKVGCEQMDSRSPH